MLETPRDGISCYTLRHTTSTIDNADAADFDVADTEIEQAQDLVHGDVTCPSPLCHQTTNDDTELASASIG